MLTHAHRCFSPALRLHAAAASRRSVCIGAKLGSDAGSEGAHAAVVNVKPLGVLVYEYVEDMAVERDLVSSSSPSATVRQRHLEYAQAAVGRGELLLGGAFDAAGR